MAAKEPLLLIGEAVILVFILKRVKKHKSNCDKMMNDVEALKSWIAKLTLKTQMMNK